MLLWLVHEPHAAPYQPHTDDLFLSGYRAEHLEFEQVTAVLNGKRRGRATQGYCRSENAYEDLRDHGFARSIFRGRSSARTWGYDQGTDRGIGCFRSRPVGVVDKQGNILHFGTLPDYVPGLVVELLDWVRDSEFHMLIKSCVFHYELELIHPFSDGNGRIKRLWHTLLLTQWKPMFAWLPVESMIHDRQDEYYQAINRSNNEVESTVFIEFMLSAIKEALLELYRPVGQKIGALRSSVGIKSSIFWKRTVRSPMPMCGRCWGYLPLLQTEFATMTEKGRIKKVRIGRSWGYIL